MAYKLILVKLTISLTFIIILYGVLVFILDPLQQYRKASFYKPHFRNQRYINPGLAKNYTYDTVIIGTSMSENFLPSDIDHMFNTETLKLSIEGSTGYEQNQILNVALKTKKVKNVFWVIDLLTFEGEKMRIKNGDRALPFYLYDDSIWNDYKYLINIDMLKKYGIKIFLGNVFGINKHAVPLERFQYWGDSFKDNKGKLLKEANLISVASIHSAEIFNLNDSYLSELKESFDYNVFDFVSSHKKVNFNIIFPPYSALFWVREKKNNKFESLIALKQYIVKKTKNNNNVKIYDFQNVKSIIYNFSNYRDYSHYSSEINDYMLHSIQNESHRITAGNVDKRIESLKNSINNFKLNITKYN